MIRVLNIYYPTRTVLLLLVEAAMTMGCFLAATIFVTGPDAYIVLNYEYGIQKLAILTVVTLLLCYYFDLYEPQFLVDRKEIYFRILFVVGLLCMALSGLVFLYPHVGMARSVLPLGFAFLTIALVLWRRLFDWAMSKDMFCEKVYVLGGGNFAQSITQIIEARKDLGMKVTGWSGISRNKDERRKHAREAISTMYATAPKLDRVIVAMEDRRGELPVQELLALRFRGVIVEEAGSFLERLAGKIQLDGLRPSSFLYTEGFRVKPSQQFTRRIVSFLVAAFGLTLFLPFFPLVALGIRLSSRGPIFFKQTRVGMGNRNFPVYKFRSMATDAEANGAKWATQNDPRVTGFGKFMRKTRIDEIPQLWNVLKGDMALVGPRPERPEFVPMLAEQLPFYDLRHMIRPGLTGWAQVRFRYGATIEDSREKLEYDLYYVKHMSLGLDLMIMFETVKTIIRRRGAQ